MSENLKDIKGVNRPKTQLGLNKMMKLIEAAEELFTTKGFYQTSISDICKSAGTAVGTFYIYFQTKTDIYGYMMQEYANEIKTRLSEAIKDCPTRYEKEREGIKCFVKYAVERPNVYNIIWGSLSVDKKMFTDYYESFARSYTYSLTHDKGEINAEDATTIAYMLMGVSNFLGLRAMFENMSDHEIDKLVDETLMPALKSGIFKN
ncbi:MAG: TetR/AcrR family transcriptional regulator [Clostridia bacterium]|nr:TetR/AcrR family transcriptional regulator [Clostridia bacterium]